MELQSQGDALERLNDLGEEHVQQKLGESGGRWTWLQKTSRLVWRFSKDVASDGPVYALMNLLDGGATKLEEPPASEPGLLTNAQRANIARQELEE